MEARWRCELIAIAAHVHAADDYDAERRGFHSLRVRQHWLAHRAWVRQQVATWTQRAPDAIVFDDTLGRALRLADGQLIGQSRTVHAGQLWGACALGVAIDIESLTRFDADTCAGIAQQFATSAVAPLEAARLWTAAEALGKALGIGIAVLAQPAARSALLTASPFRGHAVVHERIGDVLIARCVPVVQPSV